MQRSRILTTASVAAVLALMFLLSVHTLTSIYQDIGRHITLGRIIWETKSIPDTNHFSFTAPNFPFNNHHWFAEVLLYLGDQGIGLQGLIILKAIMVTLSFGLAFFAAWRPRIAVPAMIVGVFGALVMAERTDVRPEVLSFLFLGWYLFVLYRKQDTRLFWTLPMIQLLWANSHVYFFMGPFVLLAWWVGQWASQGTSALVNRRTWLLAGLVGGATLANPHGLSGALYPLTMWGNYGYSIVENQTPFFLREFGYPQLTSIATYFAIIVGVVSFVVNRNGLRRNVFGLVLFVATALLALSMVRNFPLLALCFLPVVLKNLDEAEWHFRSLATLGWGMALVVLFSMSVASGQFYQQTHMGREFGLHVPAGPQEPIDFFRRNGLKGPLFNNFDIGSFLIWKLPEEPVFIDGRPEAYPADFIQGVYIPMQEDPQVWEEKSVQYGINTIFWNEQDITPWSRTFVARILKDSHWKLVYRSHGVIILVKR